MNRPGRIFLMLVAFLAASILGVSAPVTPAVADGPPLSHVIPKDCHPGVTTPTVNDPFVCQHACPGISGCGLQACATECDSSLTCYYGCRG